MEDPWPEAVVEMNIGILGGVFDPPHIVHMLIGQLAAEEAYLDRVLLVPTGRPAHGKTPVASPQERLEMTKLAAGDNELMEVVSYEVDRLALTSYMLETVEWLRDTHPGDRLFLILGDDEFCSFHKWHKPELIADMATIICVQRSDWGGETMIPWTPMNLSPKPIFVRCEGLHWSLSSTVIRERIRAEKSIRYLVPDAVREYIKELGLYQYDYL